jgi:hypothetical protein
MNTSHAYGPAIHLNATAGVFIGLMLGIAVIFGGFSLILGTEVEFDDRSYPAWADQRYATNSAYQAIPTATGGLPQPIIVAEVAR